MLLMRRSSGCKRFRGESNARFQSSAIARQQGERRTVNRSDTVDDCQPQSGVAATGPRTLGPRERAF